MHTVSSCALPLEIIYLDPVLFPVKINFYVTPMQHLAQQRCHLDSLSVAAVQE